MEIVHVMTSRDGENGLWSIQLDDKLQCEFDLFFRTMSDFVWLRKFFSDNLQDLTSGYFGNISIDDAVERTADEIEMIENRLAYCVQRDFTGFNASLEHFFRPLNNFEYVIAHQKSKARLRNGWLRLYAIRLAANCFIITGGAVKLSLNMRKKHLEYELHKLDLTKRFLKNNHIDYPQDLNI
nr:hypothetical protein [uncultured Chitinophaga sp.]